MDELKSIPRKVWVVIGVVLLLVILTSYSQGKASGLTKCKTT